MEAYVGLFATAFLAATLVPVSSEAVLAALHAADREYPHGMLWLVATTGNTLGSVVNWMLGRFCLHLEGRRWFPITRMQLDRASAWFTHYGVWSLLLAWLPFVGDPLTFAAGLLRVRLLLFLILVAAGKGARYAFILLAV